MTITNHSGLPQPIVDAIRNDPYDPGDCDISVTRLIQPPRKVELERRHRDEITEDAADRIWALMGQLGHLILERAASGAIVEKRLSAKIGGWKVSGQIDLLGDTIVDYKFTSVWAVKEGMKPEWEEQLNCNRFLAHINGIQVNNLQIVAILRDWSKPEAARNPEMPQSQVVVLNARVWDIGDAQEFVTERLSAHMTAQDCTEGGMQFCTSEEMWERPEKWAVMAPNRKRAVKLYDTKTAATRAADTGVGHYVKRRPAERPRCEHYCNAAPFCDQFKQWKAGK